MRLDIGSKIIEAANNLRKKLQEEDYNIVIVSVGPEALVGAGHERQALAMRQCLKQLGCEDRITDISLDEIGVFSVGYPFLQRHPRFYKILDSCFQQIPPYIINDSIIDYILKQNDRSDIIRKRLSSPNFNKEKPTIFICTHVIAALSASNLINNNNLQTQGVVIEYIPDPWIGRRLRAMRSPVLAGQGETHYVVVHNPKTAAEYCCPGINPGLNPSRVFPLGTLSPVFFREQQIRNTTSYPHIAIEFSGNRIPNYDEKVLRIIETMATDLREGKIRLTIHTMWHIETRDLIEKALATLGLTNNSNIRIIHNDNRHEALETRQNCILGDQEWPAPDAVISKGGEVPLEDRGMTLVIVIFGEGHELTDAVIGAIEGRAINLIDLSNKNPEKVYTRIKEELKKPRKPPPPSLAPLALLAYLDPEYFTENILPLLNQNT